MAGNSFGVLFRISTFGESHGTAIGAVIDGCPAGLVIDERFIASEMQRRRPGQSSITTTRNEEDKVEFLSGIFLGKTTGAPLAFVIANKDNQSKDYSSLKDSYRPSHADFTYEAKYGIRDYRGGGRASARETAVRVACGAIAKLILKKSGIRIQAFVSQVGDVSLDRNYKELNIGLAEKNEVRCPDVSTAKRMIQLIQEVKAAGDSVGGVITCVCHHVPAGLGEPVFDRLHADLGKSMLSIPAVKGFELGSGFGSSSMRGSAHNDAIVSPLKKQVRTTSNFSGGIQGGISNGEDIYFRVAFKPASSIALPQKTITRKKDAILLETKGRHDPCVVPRAVPVVEAMAALVLTDHMLRHRGSRM